jgi:hypothetical protein
MALVGFANHTLRWRNLQKLAMPNEFREVELPNDWRAGVPLDLLAAVEDFVIVDDLVLGTARVDAIQFLLDFMVDADSPAEIEAFVREHEGSDLILDTDSDGKLKPSRGKAATARNSVVVPKPLFDALAKEVMTLPDEDERAIREDSLTRGLGESTGWLVDTEKLLGHLFLSHQVARESTEQDHESLLATHAGFHRR